MELPSLLLNPYKLLASTGSFDNKVTGQDPALSVNIAPSSSGGLPCLSVRSDSITSSALQTTQPLSSCPGHQTLPPSPARRWEMNKDHKSWTHPRETKKKQQGTSKVCILLHLNKESPTRPSRCERSQGPGCFSPRLPRH